MRYVYENIFISGKMPLRSRTVVASEQKMPGVSAFVLFNVSKGYLAVNHCMKRCCDFLELYKNTLLKISFELIGKRGKAEY